MLVQDAMPACNSHYTIVYTPERAQVHATVLRRIAMFTVRIIMQHLALTCEYRCIQ
jgi:hypothetical protein